MTKKLKNDSEMINHNGAIQSELDGLVVGRIASKLTFFTRQGNVEKTRQGMLLVLSEYCNLSKGLITHYSPGDGRKRKYKNQDFAGPFLEKSENTDDSLFLLAFENEEPNSDHSQPWEFLFSASGANDPNGAKAGGYIHFPANLFLDEADEMVELILKWSDLATIEHGTAGLATLNSPTATGYPAYYYDVLRHYPGLDYSSIGCYWVSVRKIYGGGYDQPSASNWLTIISHDHVEQLGGNSGLRKLEAKGVGIYPFSTGCVLRAGEKPTLGNAESGGIPAEYTAVADYIKPIRFENYREGTIKTPKHLNFSKEQERDFTLEWVRRFDSQ